MRNLRLIFVALVVLYVTPVSSQGTLFQRGDANNDAALDVSDGVFVLLGLFAGGKAPECTDAADVNDSGFVDLSDAVYLFNFLFLGGARMPLPFPECGIDSTDDDLSCNDPICPQTEVPDLPPPYRLLTENADAQRDGDFVVVRTDGVPNHTSPYFPTGDPRWEAPHAGMRVNPNRIMEQNLVFRVPLHPVLAASPSDTQMGPIGFSVSGVALFNQYAAGFTPLDNEIRSFDLHNGHPANAGLYHYHLEPLFLTQASKSGIVAVLLDGFPLYGPEEEDGSVPSGLDECNGHAHTTTEYPGGIYHYHVTPQPPYLCGCYRGTPGTQSR